ncbi:hypothetical protein ACI65C_011652 [Semiaphis heraclei]
MDSKKFRKPNSTDRQKNMLVDFIVFHPELVSGKNTIKSTVGPNKSWNEWRKTWCDLKTNIKGKAGIMRKEQNKTGGGEVDYSELSELEKKVLDVLGPTVVEGHSSISESPADMTFLKSNTLLTEDTTACYDNVQNINENTQQVSSNDLDRDDVEEMFDACFSGLEEITENDNDMPSVPEYFSSIQLPKSPIRSNSGKNFRKKKNILSRIVEASRSLASISSERNKLKANYYKQKLLLLERQTVAKEKKANALCLIAESIAAKYKINK